MTTEEEQLTLGDSQDIVHLAQPTDIPPDPRKIEFSSYVSNSSDEDDLQSESLIKIKEIYSEIKNNSKTFLEIANNLSTLSLETILVFLLNIPRD